MESDLSVAGCSETIHESEIELINANNSLNKSLELCLINPISSLSDNKSKWVIKARVVFKTEFIRWSKPYGKGTLFSMDLMDESGKIKAIAYDNECEKYFDMIEEDKVYYISELNLKSCDKRYCTSNNDYELTFTSLTKVQPCYEEETGIPQIQYNWVPLNQICNMQPTSFVNVIGICRDISDLQTIHTSHGKTFIKRDLTLVDNSKATIQLVLWNNQAIEFNGYMQPVIAVKNARVTEYNGVISLKMKSRSVLKINPDFPEGHKIRYWFDNGDSSCISNYITFKETEMKSLKNTEKTDYFQVKAVVHYISTEYLFYKACSRINCWKKVDLKNGNYICDRCSTQSPNFKYRIILNMNIEDWTSSRWVCCYNEVAEKIIGRTAEYIVNEIKKNPDNLENLLSTLLFKSFTFKLEKNKRKIIGKSSVPVSYKKYNKYLTNNLKRLLGVGQN